MAVAKGFSGDLAINVPPGKHESAAPLTFEVLRPQIFHALGLAMVWATRLPINKKAYYAINQQAFQDDFIQQISKHVKPAKLNSPDEINAIFGHMKLTPHFLEDTSREGAVFDLVIPEKVKTAADFTPGASTGPVFLETKTYDEYVTLLGATAIGCCLHP